MTPGIRVGLGRSGRSSSSLSSSSCWYASVGSHFARPSSALARASSAKMLRVGLAAAAWAAALRRGERAREEMDMGEGSAMATSAGESNVVLERVKGVLEDFFGLALGLVFVDERGESMERLLKSVRSVEVGKSSSVGAVESEEWGLKFSLLVVVVKGGGFGRSCDARGSVGGCGGGALQTCLASLN